MIETPKTNNSKRPLALAEPPVPGQEPAPFEAGPTDTCAVSESNSSARTEPATKNQRRILVESETCMAEEIDAQRYSWFRAFWLSDTPLEDIGEDFLNARTAREFDAAIDRAMLAAPRGSEV